MQQEVNIDVELASEILGGFKGTQAVEVALNQLLDAVSLLESVSL